MAGYLIHLIAQCCGPLERAHSTTYLPVCDLRFDALSILVGNECPTEESEWTRASNEESIRRRLMSLEGVVHNKYALSHLLNFMVHYDTHAWLRILIKRLREQRVDLILRPPSCGLRNCFDRRRRNIVRKTYCFGWRPKIMPR